MPHCAAKKSLIMDLLWLYHPERLGCKNDFHEKDVENCAFCRVDVMAPKVGFRLVFLSFLQIPDRNKLGYPPLTTPPFHREHHGL